MTTLETNRGKLWILREVSRITEVSNRNVGGRWEKYSERDFDTLTFRFTLHSDRTEKTLRIKKADLDDASHRENAAVRRKLHDMLEKEILQM